MAVFIKQLQYGLHSTLSLGCDTGHKSISVSGIKEALKLVLIAARTTKRLVTKCESFANVWDPTIWTELHHHLVTQDRFKASPALVGMCRQVILLVQTRQTLPSAVAGDSLGGKGQCDEGTAANKRKADAYVGVDARAKKVKRVTATIAGDKKASK